MTTALAPSTAQALDGTLAAWLSEVRARTGSARTPAEYERIVRRFLGLVESPTTAAVHAFAYAPGESGREPSPSTIAVRLAALSSWFHFLRRMGAIERNPAADVRRPRNRDAVPRGLSASELKRLLSAIPDTPAGRRDRAIVLTAVLTGLRRSEVLGLSRGDLTGNGSVYYSVRVKGGHQRHRELPPPAFVAITEYLEAAGTPLETLPDDARLFPVSSQGFALNLGRYARKAGLAGVSTHVLRHSAAKLRREAGATIEDVQRFLGHRSLATTSRYLARLEGEKDDGWAAVAAALGI
jgi:integrase/recombinase XerD